VSYRYFRERNTFETDGNWKHRNFLCLVTTNFLHQNVSGVSRTHKTLNTESLFRKRLAFSSPFLYPSATHHQRHWQRIVADDSVHGHHGWKYCHAGWQLLRSYTADYAQHSASMWHSALSSWCRSDGHPYWPLPPHLLRCLQKLFCTVEMMLSLPQRGQHVTIHSLVITISTRIYSPPTSIATCSHITL